MMKHAFVAAVAAALSLAACTATVDESDSLTASAEGVSAFGKPFVGAFKRHEAGTGYAHLVLKSDSTYFAEVNVECIMAPCDPIHEEGKWTSRAKGASHHEGSLTLRPTGGTAVTFTAAPTTGNAGFTLTHAGTSMHFERVAGATYCSQDTDCSGQPTPVNIFACTVNTAPKTVCAADSHACVAKCMPVISRDPCANFSCPTGQHCTAPADAPYCIGNKVAAPCVVTGCSGQVCADSAVITTCEYRSEYACYHSATCERDGVGKCGWAQTPALLACLAGGV
jgi:hypothetical protein